MSRHIQLFVAVGRGLVHALVRAGQRGQATAEYALVILGAAAMALLVIGWASNTSAVGDLLDRVLNAVAGRIA